MSKYIIGIDGGGTKTLAVLWDEKGKEIKRLEKGFANFSVDPIKTKEHIEEAVSEIIEGLSGDITIVMGIAGDSNFKNKDEYINKLEKKYNAKISMYSDGYLALYSVVQESDVPVLMVVGGTGSIVFANYQEKMFRMGGYGHLLGDQGSAYHVVIEAFKTMIIDSESNMEQSDFTKGMLKKLNLNHIEEIKGLVYGFSKDKVAKYAIHISELANEGNKKAIELLQNEGIYLANQVINAYNKFDVSNQEIKLALRGGFLNKASYVKETFIKQLKQSKIKFVVDESNLEPVMGAYYIYLKNMRK